MKKFFFRNFKEWTDKNSTNIFYIAANIEKYVKMTANFNKSPIEKGRGYEIKLSSTVKPFFVIRARGQTFIFAYERSFSKLIVPFRQHFPIVV